MAFTKPVHLSTKTYGHGRGLSCCFRQWRADSHCNLMHGYAIAVKLTFESRGLDHRNWVVDFGGLKEIEQWLKHQFDHTTLVAEDDPKLVLFKEMEIAGLIDLRVVPAVGCESFAVQIAEVVQLWINENLDSEYRVQLRSVEVREHESNSALYEPAKVI